MICTTPYWVALLSLRSVAGQGFLCTVLIIEIDIYECAGLLYSVLITAVITDAIKDGVGRPRPDFFWRCFPDGKAVCSSVHQFPCFSASPCLLLYFMIYFAPA